MYKLVVMMSCFFINHIWDQNTILQTEVLLETDRQFAQTAVNHGIIEAFIKYSDEECVILPDFGHPVRGRSALEHLTDINKPVDLHQIWKPIFADVSGDLGYTFGRFALENPDSVAYKKLTYTYYESVWKRGRDGNWTLLFHVGLLIGEHEEDSNSEPVVSGERALLIMDVDRDFSSLSRKRGYLEAFHYFIDDDGLALSGNRRPPLNKERYRLLLEESRTKDRPNFQLTWEPIHGIISSSGDLGVTSGRYISTYINSEGEELKGYGYYLSIWRKQSDGSWKFVLDGGNHSAEFE